MEPVGAAASILTFVTVAFSATKSIRGALSAIKDGPEILSSINNEISQLQNILQRLLQVVSSTARPTDRSNLEQMVKKCRDDLVGFESKLRQFDALGADGRRGQLWRKLKTFFEEKDLERICHSIGRHVQLLTLHLGTIQDEQTSLIATQSTELLSRIQQLQHTSSTATQSTEILKRIEFLQETSPTATQLNEVLVSLQQLQQDMAVLQVSSTSAQNKIRSSGISPGIGELDDENLRILQETALDDTIARLMRLIEKKPSIMEFDDAEEIFNDLERLLQSVRDHVHSTKTGDGDQDEDQDECPDVSKEIKLFTSLVFSAQSLGVNQTQPMNSFDSTEPKFAILQQKKRKEIDTGDNVLTVTTAKRRRQPLPLSGNAQDNEACGWGFLGNLTVKSKTKKRMISLSVNRGQLLFDRFTSMMPRVIVCQILPNNSQVFRVASEGSVQDLMRLIVENKASLHDHDENGWSLLHHAVTNPPTLRFLIQQGLDVDEVAEDKDRDHNSQTNPLGIAYKHIQHINSSDVLLYAGADPIVELEGNAMFVTCITSDAHTRVRNMLYRTFFNSPLLFSESPEDNHSIIYGFCRVWAETSAGDLNPEQERQNLDILISHGYSVQTLEGNQSGLHAFFLSKKKSFSRVLERRDLLVYLISRGTDPFVADFWGQAPSYYAYGRMCKPCSMSQSSVMGDLWDTVLDICGYDVSMFRRHYPRRASYKNGYNRETFEELWRGREERCPYWNDEPWPAFSNEESESSFEWTLSRGLCYKCRSCLEGLYNGPCNSCGICLLVFEYSCAEKSDLDHQHNSSCLRSQVGYFEHFEACGHSNFRPISCSESDADDENFDYDKSLSSNDETEDEQSPPDQRVTRHPGYDSEEIISEDESVGGVSL